MDEFKSEIVMSLMFGKYRKLTSLSMHAVSPFRVDINKCSSYVNKCMLQHITNALTTQEKHITH
ncbi:hypothetical protein PA25_33060 [Pseudoalteromonas sp. A25]|nr:hypothetical protein PA25_33060 [Pseudoalteromonas sp. A25]